MLLHVLSDDDPTWFPPAESAWEDGLLAIGGDLRPERLLAAYQRGIFPWFSEDEPPLWWCPDPRFVLFPEALKVSKSMRPVLRSGRFDFRVNTAFGGVIAACREAQRPGQDGTWITDEVQQAYTELHRLGYAHSAESWQDGQLVGGLYGVLLGRVFFGESMFSKVSNASKAAFIQWVGVLKEKGIVVIDCQVYTEHLESLGARMVRRADFLQLLARYAAVAV